jgi:hypothetical protein
MTDESADPEARAAADPRVPPRVLAEVAARRWDLHPTIWMNPQAYPELRQWIATVNPAGVPQAPPPAPSPAQSRTPAPQPRPTVPAQHPGTAPLPPARRTAIGWWLGGCGCLLVVGIVVLVVIASVLAGLGEASPSSRDDRPAVPQAGDDGRAQEHLASYHADRAAYDQFAVELIGNPVAPLVLNEGFVRGLEREAAERPMSEAHARSIAERMREFRDELEVAVATARDRRVNASGTLTEQLVDEAGDGFIDVRWDAVEACGTGDGSIGCTMRSDPLTIHLASELELPGDWQKRMVVTHELAHVYQAADAARFDDGSSAADRLLASGLFQGSNEKMADCYSLTVLDEWSLRQGNVTLGYGYVCDATERQAIRDWAAELNAPTSG